MEKDRRFQHVLIVVFRPFVTNVAAMASFQSLGSPSIVGLKYGALATTISWRRVTRPCSFTAVASTG